MNAWAITKHAMRVNAKCRNGVRHALLGVIVSVVALGITACGAKLPVSRSLTVAIQPAEDLWSNSPPQHTPAALASSGLLIFENNDDSDAAAGADDTDAIVNGTADMRQMTTLIVRRLTSTPAASDLLHVKKSGGSGNVNVFRKAATPAASSRILETTTSATTTPSVATQLINDAKAADVLLLIEGVDPGDVSLCIDWSGTQVCPTFHVRTGFTPRIFADTDRNSLVEPVTDLTSKHVWSEAQGAIVFVNNDRDCVPGRADNDDTGVPSQLIRCANDQADISELQIPSAALALSTSPGWSAVIRFAVAQQNYFRIFSGLTTPSAQLSDTAQTVSGIAVREIDVSALAAVAPTLRLGIEGREFDKPIDLFLCVMHTASRLDAACDRVALHTGRLLLQANDEPIGQALVAEKSISCGTAACPVSNSRLRSTMTADLAGGERQSFPTSDQWVQDEVEICGQRAPRGTSQVVIHLKRNAVPCSPSEETCAFFHTTFPAVGTDRAEIDTHGLAGVDFRSRNYGGNLEVSQFTAGSPGKIILGANMDPPLITFLEARAPRQAPAVKLNVGWLAVGHVDEVMAVVPGSAGSQRIALADVLLGRDLLTGGIGLGVPAVPVRAALFWHCQGAARDRLPSCYGDGTVASATTGPATLTSDAFDFTKPAGHAWQFLRFYDGAAKGQVAQLGAIDPMNPRKIGIVRVWRLDTPDWIRCAATDTSDSCDVPAANAGRAPGDSLAPPAASVPFWPGSRFVRNTWFVTPTAGDRFVVVEDSLDWDPWPDGTAGKAAKLLPGPKIRFIPALHTAGELRAAIANPTFWDKQADIAKILYGPPVPSMRTQLAGLPGGPTIIRLPMIYQVKRVGGVLSRGESFMPASVNLQVFRHSGGTLILVPKPYGPSTGGADPYETLISARLAGLGAIRFVDDWEVYHILMGEVHCGTNQTKATARPWWTP